MREPKTLLESHIGEGHVYVQVQDVGYEDQVVLVLYQQDFDLESSKEEDLDELDEFFMTTLSLKSKEEGRAAWQGIVAVFDGSDPY